MSTENEDYPVAAISDEEIEKIALRVRLYTETANQLAPDVIEIFSRVAEPSAALAGTKLEIVPDQEMGKDLALAFVDEKILKIRASVHIGAIAGNPRDRFTVAHELGHFILKHGGVPKHRVAMGNKKLSYIAPSKSAERQANVFAAALLMPREQTRKCQSPTEISHKMKVSLKSAEIRFKQVVPKTTPVDIARQIDELKNSTQKSGFNRNVKSVLSPEQNKNIAWEIADHIPDQDPSEYRVINKKWLIRKSKFQSSTVGGWRLEGDVIIAWEDEHSR